MRKYTRNDANKGEFREATLLTNGAAYSGEPYVYGVGMCSSLEKMLEEADRRTTRRALVDIFRKYGYDV